MTRKVPEALLDEAGYPRGADGIRFKTRLQILQGTQDLGYAEIAASYWAEIGVDVEIDVSGLDRISRGAILGYL